MIEPPCKTLVVVGAGLAGLRVAEGARQAGLAGRVVLISDEPHEPYDRPPLSKALLLGHAEAGDIGLCQAGAWAEQRIEFMAGRTVVAIDRKARRVALAGGEVISYDVLVLATGSRVRTLAALPPGSARVFYLRTLDDALAIRAGLAHARRVVVVGAGVIGLEVAAAANSNGRSVTVIEAGDRVMARTSCPLVSDYFERRHRDAGVTFRFGATVDRAAPAAGGALALTLSDGAVIEADLVAVGVGVASDCEVARDCGLEVEPGGIVVDGLGRSSDPAIFAAGEAALHFNALSGRRERQETWAHAAAHGEHVGRSLVAPDADYAEISSYWTDQYDINLQTAGAPAGEIDLLRGAIASGSFVVFHITGGRMVGVSAVNAVRELRAAKKLIGRPANAEALADPARPLKELV
jgi:3-phenylpropionate/trans-cinnamate dioxygenase ferredoxin reductase component